MGKTLLTLILLLCILFSATFVSAEETEEREWQQTMGGWFSFSTSDSNDDNHEDKSKEPQPTPQPALDLPFDRVFYIATLLICLIVMFPAKKTISQLCFYKN